MSTLKLLLLSVIFLICQLCIAQETIQVNPPEFVYPCGTFTYEVTVFASLDDPFINGELSYSFPEGIDYVIGSISSSEVTEADTQNPNSPIFTLPNPLVGFFTFSFMAMADCGITEQSGGLIDEIEINHAGGVLNFMGTNYNRNIPELEAPNCINIAEIASLGSTFTRGCTVVNSGFAPVYELYLIDNFNTSVLNGSALGGEVVANNPLTIRYDADDFVNIGNNDGVFDQNESIDLMTTIEVIACGDGASQLSFAYGCNEEICDIFRTVAVEVVPESSIPILTSNILDYRHAIPCEPGFVEMEVTNTGTELNEGAAAAIDVLLNYGMRSEDDILFISNCIALDNFTINGNAVTITSAEAGGYFIDSQQFNSNTDGAGGLEDLDNDGFFDDLGAGESIQVRFDVTWDANCSAGGCPDEFPEQALASIFSYNAQCDDDILTDFAVYEDELNYFVDIANPSFSFQTVEQEITINIGLNTDFGILASACPDADIDFSFSLPEGLVLPSDFAPVFDNIPVVWSVNGSIVNFTFPMDEDTGINDLLSFVLEGSCPPPPDPSVCPEEPINVYSLPYELDFNCQPTCNESLPVMCSNTPLFEIGCPSDGILIVSETLISGERQSVGWTDASYTQKQDLNTPGLLLQNALPGDTILFTTTGIMNGEAFFDSLRFELSQLMNNPANAPYYLFAYAELELHDTETGGQVNCPIDLTETYVLGQRHYDAFEIGSFTAPGGCMAAYDLNEGDSIFLKSYYVLQPIVPTNLITANMVSVIKGGNFCPSDVATMNIIQPDHNIVHRAVFSGLGCDDIEIQMNYRQALGAPWGDLFPYEYRSFIDFDSIVYYFPDWVEVIPDSATYYYQERTGGTAFGAIQTIQIPVANPTITDTPTGQRVVFRNNPLLAADMCKQGAFSSFRFKLKPNCLNTFRLEYTVEAHMLQNHYDASNRVPVMEEQFKWAPYRAFNMSMAVDNPIFPGLSDVAEWEFEYCYQGNGVDYVPNNWFLIDLPNSDIQPILLEETLGDGTITTYEIDNLDGSEDYWVEIGDLNRNTCRFFKLYAEYTTCESTDFTIQSDFACGGYPLDPTIDEYNCVSNYPAINLNLNPQEAVLQVNLSSAPNSPVPLCEEIPFIMRIINGGLGGAVDPTVTFNLPETGMYYVPGSSILAVGQGSFVPLSDPIFNATNGEYQWNLSAEIASFPGLSAVPENEFRVGFSVMTDCNYDPRSFFTYRTDWVSVCDDPGATVDFFSLPIPLLGAPTSFNQYDLTLDSGPTDACNAQSQLTLEMQYLGGGAGNVTSDLENIRVYIPNEFTYAANSYTPITNMPINNEPTIEVQGDSTILIWPMPVGLNIGDMISFNFGLTTPIDADCQTLGVRSLAVTTVDVPCSSTAGGFCEIDFFGEETLFDIDIERAEFAISIENFASTPSPPMGEATTFDLVLENISNSIVNGDIELSIWFDNGDGVFNSSDDIFDHDLTITASELGNGMTISTNDALFFTAANACNGFFVTLSEADNVCTCEGAVVFLQPELTSQNTETLLCSETAPPLGTFSIDGYTYTWEDNPYLSSLNESQVTYMYNGPSSIFIDTLILAITRPAGCVTIDTTIITTSETSADLDVEEIDCFGNTGTLIGITPAAWETYTVAWSHTGNTDQTQANLPSGTYGLTLTDAVGCVAESSAILVTPELLTLDLTGGDISCYGENTGEIAFEIEGGTEDYNLTWSPFIGTGQNLAAGTYTVTLTDANGCTVEDDIELTEPEAPLAIELTIADLQCFGENTGSIASNTSGGTGVLSTMWSPEIGSGQNLAAGTYNVTLSDENGCQLEEQTTIQTPPSIDADLVGTNVDCFGNETGEITFNPIGGTGVLNTTWSPDIGNGQNLAAGVYMITITDENNCNVLDQITLTQPAAPLQIDLTGADINCYGENTGEITSEIEGGTEDYNLSWSPFIGAGQNLAAGTYTVTLTDANGCTVEDDIELTEPEAPLTIELTTTDLQCFGENTGSIESNTNGGTGVLSTMWSPDIGSGQNLAAGTYNVTLVDENACELEEQVTIQTPPQIDANLAVMNVDCFGNETGEIAFNPIGGTGVLNTNWSPDIGNGQNLAAGVYMITITDENNCEIQDQANLTQPVEIILETESEDITCAGDNDGVIYILSPDQGDYQYSLNGTNWQNQPIFDNLAAGSYEVIVSGENGCTETQQLELSQPPGTLLIAPADTVLQLGDSILLEPYYHPTITSVEWTPSDYLSCDTCFNAWSKPSQSVLYTITGTTLSGCTARDEVYIELNKEVFAPNVFTPNNDGSNDKFTIYTPNAVGNIDNMQIFDRWGEMVFEKSNFPPNFPALGWDGQLKGRDMNPQVFVWQAFITLINGEKIHIYGDVTLIR